MPNDRLEDVSFERGIRNFTAVCSVIKSFKKTRVLQIAPRPAGFWTVMCNEGELLEKFGIQIHPVTLSEVVMRTKSLRGESGNAEVLETIEYINSNMACRS